MNKKQMKHIIKYVKKELKLSVSDNIQISFLNTDFEFMLTDKNLEELKKHFKIKVTGILGYVEFSNITTNKGV